MNNYVNFQNCKNAGNPASKNSSFWTFDQGYIDISGHAWAISKKIPDINYGRNFMLQNNLK